MSVTFIPFDIVKKVIKGDPIPCPSWSPQAPIHDTYMKTKIEEGIKRKEIWSYQLSFENKKIINEKPVGSINSEELMKVFNVIINKIF